MCSTLDMESGIPIQQTNEELVQPIIVRKRVAHSRANKNSDQALLKRTVKYLSVARDPKAYSATVRAAPDSVIKTIANAAFNVEQGDINLTPAQKTVFRQYRKQIAALTSRKVSVPSKRRIVQSQKGGFPFIPILIGTALSLLGSRLFGGQQQQ